MQQRYHFLVYIYIYIKSLAEKKKKDQWAETNLDTILQWK